MTGQVDERGYYLWESVQPLINAGATVHASASGPPTPALCGLSGHQLIVLDLSHPEARPHRALVTCPACLEWMHA